MKEFLQYNLLQLGNFSLTVGEFLKFIGFVLIIVVLLHLIKKTIFKISNIGIAKRHSVYSLIKYIIIVFSCVIGFQLLGFNVSVLLAGSAALLVGIGLGLQSLFSDFVSGIILLLDSSIRVNDVVDVNGLVCTVQEINLRTTTVLTRDDKYMILPNTALTANHVVNWTHNHRAARFDVVVGVDYDSDVTLVMALMKDAIVGQDKVLDFPLPFVRLEDYGDSALMFHLHFWTEEVFRVENIKSDIRIKIFQKFKENAVTISFPQRVVHIKHDKEEDKAIDAIP